MVSLVDLDASLSHLRCSRAESVGVDGLRIDGAYVFPSLVGAPSVVVSQEYQVVRMTHTRLFLSLNLRDKLLGCHHESEMIVPVVLDLVMEQMFVWTPRRIATMV